MSKPSGKTILPQLTVAGVLGAGALGAWLFAAGLLIAILTQRSRSDIEEALEVTPSGKALVAQYHRGGNFTTYRTLEGEPLTESLNAQPNYGASLSAGDEHPHSKYLTWYERIYGFNNTEVPPVLWYLVHDSRPNGHAYFTGFSSASKQPMGYIGLAGFRMQKPPLDEQFSINIDSNLMNYSRGLAGIILRVGRQPYPYNGPYAWLIYLVSGGKLWVADLNQRSVHALDGLSDVVSVNATIEPAGEKSADYIRRVIVRTLQKIYVLDSGSKTVSSFPIPEELQHKTLRFLNWWSSSPIFVQPHWPGRIARVFWQDSQGKVTKQQDVELLTEVPESLQHKAWKSAVLLPAPVLAGYAVLFGLPHELISNGVESDYATALNRVIAVAWPAYLLVCLLSVALAIWCYRRHRRYSEKGAAMWAVFVLLFGAPAIIGYQLHRRWPVTEHCHKCAAETPRDRDTCLSCGADLPLPVLKGIEVFA